MNVAKAAAEALPILERANAYLYTDFWASRPADRQQQISELIAAFTIINYGRTPATINLLSFRFELVDDLSMVPAHSELLNDWDFVVAGGGRYPEPRPEREGKQVTYFERNTFTIQIDERQSADILDGKLFPVMLGRLTYADIFGGRCEQGTCVYFDGRTDFLERHPSKECNYRRNC